MHMLRRTMGMAMPMKLAMEKKVKNGMKFVFCVEIKFDLAPGCE